MHRLKDLPPLSPDRMTWVEAYKSSPVFDMLGISLVKIEPGFSLLEMTVRKEHTHNGGIVQGGIITVLADSAIAYAVRSALREDAGQTSIDLKINFIRPVSAGKITAEGWLVHLGRRTAVGESIVLDERGKTIAKCLSSVLVMPGEGIAQEEGQPPR